MNHNPITFYRRENDEKLEHTLRYNEVNRVLLYSIKYEPVSDVPFTGFLDITVIGGLKVVPKRINLASLEMMPKLPGNLFFRNHPEILSLPTGAKTVTMTLHLIDYSGDFEFTLNHTCEV